MSVKALSILLLAAAPAAAQPTVLSGQVDGRDLATHLHKYLRAKAAAQLEARRVKVESIRTRADLDARRAYVREKVTAAIGGFPARTPLNARVTGVIDRPGHRVEKVIFESQPGFHVTANLYVPKRGQGPYPAILFPLGHEQGAKSHHAWQSVLVTMAERGYVTFAWDTLGQGERIQLWDADMGESKVIRSTTEHTILGLQCLLVGDALARYTIWDGMRALDYLLSRPEVDKNRVGLTGNSGGGTHTAYIGALDDRIHVAAPSCYLTSWSRLLDTIGPQDAEQCMPPFLADGLDHPDFVLAFAPKPYMMLSAIRDFFSIEGARDTARETKRLYDSLSFGDRMGMTEADDGHGYSLPRREAAYRWFGKWLKGSEDTAPEVPVAPAAEDDLWCTDSGQVAVSLGGETVFTLNQKRFTERRQPFTSAAQVASFIGFAPPSGVTVRDYGSEARDGYTLRKLTLRPEAGIVLPALLYEPKSGGRKQGVVMVASGGKGSAHADSEELAKSGRVVLSVDLRGWGELGSPSARNGSDWPRYFGDYENAMTALLTGKSLAAMRAEDVASALSVLAGRPDVDPATVTVFAKDYASVPALYAAALTKQVKRLWIERGQVSYESAIRGKLHRGQWEAAVHGALRHYDLPQLARWAEGASVRLIDPVDAGAHQVKLEEARKLYAGATVVRRRSGPVTELVQ